MVCVRDEASNQFNSNARSANQSLGGSFNNIYSGGFRGSYALLGIAGSGINSQIVFEAIGSRFAPPVSATRLLA